MVHRSGGFKGEMNIKLDVNNMFAERAGSEHGFVPEEIDQMKSQISSAHNNIQEARKSGELQFLDLPYSQKEVVSKIKNLASERYEECDNFVVLGIGGSALGNIALHTALNSSAHNLNAEKRGDLPRWFVIDNVDPVRFKSLLDSLDLNRTIFNVISKSGSTVETLSQFSTAYRVLAEFLTEEEISRRFIITTTHNSGFLFDLSQKEGFSTFNIPENVGGRFSVLSPVGLVSAAFCGIDIEKLLSGAEAMDNRCRTDDPWKNPAYLNAVLEFLAYGEGKHISIMMPYSHSLRNISDWFRQLWAESLGKEYARGGDRICFGPTPVNALGATDQHSQVQLYMEGPFDKLITFIEVGSFSHDLNIPHMPGSGNEMDYIADHKFSELLQIEKEATERALTERGRINKTIYVPEINEFTLGQLLYMFQLQTVMIGELMDINVLNQPGVELGKDYIYSKLGREGYENENDLHPAKKNDFIL